MKALQDRLRAAETDADREGVVRLIQEAIAELTGISPPSSEQIIRDAGLQGVPAVRTSPSPCISCLVMGLSAASLDTAGIDTQGCVGINWQDESFSAPRPVLRHSRGSYRSRGGGLRCS